VKRFSVTAEFEVLADTQEEANVKLTALLVRLLPTSTDNDASNELPWSPKGPGCTALV
jgi:hypothetical protein